MSPRPFRPARARAVTAVSLATAAVVGLSACSGGSSGPAAPSTATESTSVSTPSTHAGTSTPAPKPSTSSASQLKAAAEAQIQTLIKKAPSGGVSLAALNTKTGAAYSAGAKSGMWTASAYKLFVLETLLLQTQGSGGLSGSEESQSVPMIEQSDNVAGYALWEDAGGNSGLSHLADVLGMDHTDADGTDPTFTTMSGPDGLKLVKALVDKDSPLNKDSRDYALHLMHNVESDQRWGVGQAADKGTDFANKNGWLSIDNSNGPGENDDGLWAVNSLGVITVHGQQVLMAVFTRHNDDFDSGKALVAQLAKATAQVVSPG